MPKEKPAPQAAQSVDQTIALFFENVARQRAWYRRQNHPGQSVGHIVAGEMMLSLIETALACAMAGKRWEEPADSP